jgi:hypothetical protein
LKEGAMLARLLRQIAKDVEGMDESELKRYVRAISGLRAGKRKPTPFVSKVERARRVRDESEIKKILLNLENARSRQDGSDILEEHSLSRVELMRLAKLRNIHVTKSDNVERINEKLVEAIIGARLGSIAIRGG